MRLQESIRQDLKQAIKDKDEERKNTLRILIGEFGRSESKNLSDQDVVKIIRKMIKSEQETLEKAGGGQDSRYIAILSSYLPLTASDEEIQGWILENIDFSKYRNRMQAMRDIMAHFGERADGGRVKTILEQI
jgi:hypothetical protein